MTFLRGTAPERDLLNINIAELAMEMQRTNLHSDLRAVVIDRAPIARTIFALRRTVKVFMSRHVVRPAAGTRSRRQGKRTNSASPIPLLNEMRTVVDADQTVHSLGLSSACSSASAQTLAAHLRRRTCQQRVAPHEADYAGEYAVLHVHAAREHGGRSGCAKHRDDLGS